MRILITFFCYLLIINQVIPACIPPIINSCAKQENKQVYKKEINKIKNTSDNSCKQKLLPVQKNVLKDNILCKYRGSSKFFIINTGKFIKLVPTHPEKVACKNFIKINDEIYSLYEVHVHVSSSALLLHLLHQHNSTGKRPECFSEEFFNLGNKTCEIFGLCVEIKKISKNTRLCKQLRRFIKRIPKVINKKFIYGKKFNPGSFLPPTKYRNFSLDYKNNFTCVTYPIKWAFITSKVKIPEKYLDKIKEIIKL
jgi:carbonic anhydrase